ncbi:BspA family leucine-rich repeat surface protein [Enterococcus hulanensis]|uniref:BspA family leucine-rich repeat surface protein n=1 Tax=Enterococcus hulanensis TaxID=2559929 RepID=UPI0028919349|nr:BspA family leucine-rich repeat surface protein [Enterococcus hulanensis]MDT2662671.1 BspA family leucine-rich repeat surface protein [Enterococcus hulanensis]
MNKKRMGKQAERIQRFVYKKINKQLISVAGSVLIVLGSYAIVPIQVLATETATEETAQAQPNTAALPTVASSELASETPPPTANQEGAAQETPPTTTDDAKAPKETEPKSADEEKKSEETDQQADTAKTRAQAQPRATTTSEGWEYENRGTYVEITDYTGDVVNITVPAKIDGLPVEINLGTVLKEKMAGQAAAPTETFKIERSGEGETPVKLVGTFEDLFGRRTSIGGFYENTTLTSVDFGNANCSEIESVSNMFSSCKTLENVDLSGWNTNQVQDMSYMFYNCSQLKEVNLSGWDTSQIASGRMYGMFSKCDNLSTLTLSSDFEFKDDTGLRGLPDADSRWVKDDSATMYDSTGAFIEAHNDLAETATNHTYTIKTLDNPTAEGWGFDDKGSYMEITSYNGDPTNITVPAKIYGKPVEINLGTVLKEKMANENGAVTQTFKIESAGEGETPVKLVGTFKELFSRVSDPSANLKNATLISVDFGNADCSEIEDMESMFANCTQLQELELSGWNTSKVVNMYAMFYGCTQLEDLNLSGWETSNVENMRQMFYGCSQLKDINLSGWDTSNVQNMSYMFWGSDNLSKLTLSSDFEFKDDTQLRGLTDADSRWVKDDSATMYDSTDAFIAAHNDLAETATNHTYKIKTLDNPTAEGWWFDDKGTYMEITSYDGDPTHITVPAKIYGKPVEIDLGTVLKNQMANKTEAVTQTFKIESADEGETPVKLVGTFRDLFARPSGGGGYTPNTTLTSADFGNADCSEIQDMSYMFCLCNTLKDLNVTGWNTSQVQDMSYMFFSCSQLKDLDVSGWNTSQVQDMSGMFFSCSQLPVLDVSGWNTSQVQDMSSMFNECSQLKDLNLSGWNTSKVQDMSFMFQECSQLKDLNLSGWNTSKVQDMSNMFSDCSQLKDLNLSGWNTSKVEKMSSMFSWCSQLQDLNLSGWNTSNVWDMSWMFSGSDNLSKLTLSSDFEFKGNTYLRGLTDTTSRWVKDDFAAMYDSTTAFIAAHNNLSETATNHTYKIKALDNPTAEGWGFKDKGTYMEISSYNGDPTNITVPAKIYGKPVEIDLGTVLKEQMANKTEAVTQTFKIESAGEGETPVKLVGTFKALFARPTGSGGYTPNTTLTSVDFGNADCSEIQDMSYMFSFCRKLQDLDLSSWNTSKVENMSTMFFECSQLKDLNLSSWNTSKVRDMDSMFSFCSQLKDLNLSGWNTSKVENMSSMFYYCEKLQELDVSGWDTSQVQIMFAMFVGCSQLKDLNLSDWDTSKVQDMGAMFLDCSELKELDLIAWNTSNVENMNTMFSGCSQLQDLNLSGWITSQVQNMNYMFDQCSQLQELDVSDWETSQVQTMNNMFRDCTNLSKLTLSSDFEFQSGHSLRGLPANSGKTTYHWVKDDYKADYDSTADFTTAHNNLTGASTNHVYTIQKKHEVSFDLNGGSGNTPDPQYIFEGKLADAPDYKGTKGDLIFVDWTLNSIPFTFDKQITEPIELTASWRKAKYTIKFDPNGGEGTMSDQDLTVDEEQQLPANQFTRKGYDFDGWNKESDGGGDSYSDKEAVKNLSKTDGAQVKLYAQWKPIAYTVTFDTKDGKPTTSENYTIEQGIDKFASPTRTGYTFEGWYDGAKKVTKIETGETGNRTLEAKWKLETYKVTFNSKGGTSVPNETYTIEKGIDSFAEPQKAHYSFDGWYDGEDKVTKIEKGETGDRTLIAKWTPVTYKVTFNSNGGTHVSEKEYTIETGIDTFKTPTRTGYIFDGWYDGQTKVESIPVGETGNRSLEAKWKIETYTVTFDSKNGSAVSQKTYTIEKGIDSFETPTRTGYKFEGWYDGEDKVTKIEKGETGDRTLIAKWTPVTYKVTFDSAGGSQVQEKAYTIEQGIDKFAEPQKAHYTFDGWYDGEEKVTKIEKGETGNRTLIAKWTPVSYTVTFNSNGGTLVSNKTYTIEKGIDSFKTPTRSGYTFDGWYDGEEKVTKIEDGETGNRALEAKWKIETYTVTFDSNDGSSILPKTYTIEKGIASFETPIRSGYTFEGWYDGEDKVTKIEDGETGNRALEARWKLETYKVTFDSNGGSKVSEKEYTIKKGIDSFAEPTKAHYTFEGWYDGEEKVTTIGKGETGNRTLIAKWTPVTYKVTFDSAGGNAIDPMPYTIEETISTLPTPTRKGHKFIGWFEGENLVTEIPIGGTSDRTLTAKWEVIPYTIHFEGDVLSPITYTISDQSIALPDGPERAGYRFLGWLVSEEKLNRSAQSNNTIVRSLAAGTIGNLRLTAQYEAIKYKVTFDSAGGSTVDPISFTTENSVTKLPEPARIGYRFLGWYDGETKVTELPKGTIGDKTLTAKWEKIKTTEVIEDILKEENQKNRKEQDYTEDSWKNYQEAKKAAEDLLKETTPDPLKAEQVLAKLQAAIKGLTLKDATAPTPVGTTNIPVSKKVYPTAQAKQYPRTNMITTIWPGFIGTGLVAAVIALIKKNKK